MVIRWMYALIRDGMKAQTVPLRLLCVETGHIIRKKRLYRKILCGTFRIRLIFHRENTNALSWSTLHRKNCAENGKTN